MYGKGNLKTNKNNIHLLININSDYLNLDKIYSATEKNNIREKNSNNQKKIKIIIKLIKGMEKIFLRY